MAEKIKLISLNTWGGRGGKKKLLDFFDNHRDVDIFCLQEIWADAYDHLDGHKAGGIPIVNSMIMTKGKQEIDELLENHQAYFRPHHGDNYGLLMMVRSELKIVEEGEVFVYKEKGYVPKGDAGLHPRNVQYITFQTESGLRTIMNFHGLWNGKGKDDSEDRLSQSRKIVDFTKRFDHPFVLCGDFNLNPDTESIKILEDNGLRNLIKEFEIKSTRTSHYNKPGKFADYVMISGGISVSDFKVLPDEVSDHAPLYLEFK